MKRAFLALLACVVLLACLPLRAYAAINFDGYVDPTEWFDCPAAPLFPQPSLCGITYATVRTAPQPGQNRVLFGFNVFAPGAAPDSPVGAVFLLGAREIGRWQLGPGAAFDAVNYDLRGLAWFPQDSINGGFTFEIALGCKTEGALSALRDLSVQLFDALGVPSRPVPSPVVITEPVTTTKATITEKTTTTKAPTTTTTKAPTTEKPTTTKAAATQPVYTTAPPAYAPAPQTTTTRTAAAPQAAPTAGQAQPGTSRTETVWYTVVYTDAPDGMETTGNQVPWTYAPLLTEPSLAQTLPTLAMPAAQASRPASRSAPLLYAGGGLLVLLAAALVVLWLRAQRKPEEQEPS